jgi:type IV secretory pathway TrbF-like protein
MKWQTPAESKAPGSPYLDARREWNERYGDQVQAAKTWRMAAFLSLGIALAAVGGLVTVAVQSKVVPYVVQLNRHSDVVRVERADVLRRPDANAIRAALANWVVGARTVYTDAQAMKHLIDATYAMTLPNSPAYQALAAYDRANDPYERAATQSVSVQVTLVVPVSDSSWEVDWRETTRSSAGKVISTKDWTATLTVALIPPSDVQQVLLNPLGVYVRQFAWSSRLPSH